MATGDASSDSWTDIGTPVSGTNTNRYTLAEEDVDEQVRATVSYTDRHGPNKSAESDATAAVVAANSPPVLGGAPMVSLFFAENATSALDTLTAYDAEGDTLVWSLAGADSSAFRLAWLDPSRRALHFKTPPNYEALAGSFGNVYALWVIVGDAGTPSLADSVSVAVTIQDVDDAGVVALSSLTPQVGDELKATLTDEDVPLENLDWSWSYFHAAAVSGLNGSDLAERSRTLPVSTVHLGSRLLARVSYTDWHGDQRAHSDTTAAVVGPPWQPQLTAAEPGAGQVVLRWTAPVRTGGSAIVRYESWHSGEGGVLWSPVVGGASADSVTVGGLTNGQEYTLAVRAVNQQFGAGAADNTQATPQAANHAPVIAGPDSVSFAENDLSAVATYTATAADGADTLEWQAQAEGRANGTPMELVCWCVQGYLL